jgi:hypothetical protein
MIFFTRLFTPKKKAKVFLAAGEMPHDLPLIIKTCAVF